MRAFLGAMKHVYAEAAAVPSRPAAIVPGCLVRDGEPSVVLADRLAAALALHQLGRVATILVSGTAGEVTVMGRWLEERGVPSGAITTDSLGLRTMLTMRRAKAVFGVDGAVVCTNRFHMRRSVFLARSCGIDAVGLIADRQRYRTQRKNEAREIVAHGRALLEVYVLRLSQV